MTRIDSKDLSIEAPSFRDGSPCPNCGTYVTSGASDCAKCGLELVLPTTRHEKAHGQDLQNILIVMSVITGMFLLVGMLVVWVEFDQGNTKQVIASVALVTISAVQFRGIWRMWQWRKQGVVQYFAVTFVVLSFGWVYGDFKSALVSGTIINLSFLYRISKEWSRFE